MQKKAQLTMGDAPTIVLLVGLVFLVMATIAFIGEKYGDSLDTDNVAGTVTNETVTGLNNTLGDLLSKSTLKNAECAITTVYNATGGQVVTSGNYTLSGCRIYGVAGTVYNSYNVNVTYRYTYSASTIASNVTSDMNTEIGNNTSIAGIVLTISLVGIVLSILIGVFLGIRRTRI
jgi:hypothetical protein